MCKHNWFQCTKEQQQKSVPCVNSSAPNLPVTRARSNTSIFWYAIIQVTGHLILCLLQRHYQCRYIFVGIRFICLPIHLFNNMVTCKERIAAKNMTGNISKHCGFFGKSRDTTVRMKNPTLTDCCIFKHIHIFNCLALDATIMVGYRCIMLWTTML